MLAGSSDTDAWAPCVCASSYRVVSPVLNRGDHYTSMLYCMVHSTSCVKIGVFMFSLFLHENKTQKRQIIVTEIVLC